MDSINNLTMKKFFVSALVALCGFTASYAQEASFLSNNHCLYRISQESQNQKCLLLPVQELSLIHISEPTRQYATSRMPSSA